MPPVEDHAQLASDAELITRVRAGDRSAFGDLYSRHAGAALSLARQFSRSSSEADDLVSEAFARVLDGMLESKGPDTAFRAYLFTTLRNTAYDRSRKDKRLQFTDDMESYDVAVEGDDPIIADLEKGLIGKAFAGLPERWQTVLWHLQVEGQSAAEVGVLLGMAPNAVSSLAFRAREGLREAYLQAHLAETAAERCRTTVDRLGAWTRGGLSKREKAQVEAHLAECDRCPALAAELSEINTGLRSLLAPLLLGSAAVGYLATLGPVVPLAQLGVLTGGKAFAGFGGKAALGGKTGSSKVVGGKAAAAGGKGIAGHAAAGLAKIGSFGTGAVVAGVAAAAAVVVAGVAIALSSGHPAPPTADTGSGVAAAVTSGPVAGGGGPGGGGPGGGSNANGGGGGGGSNGNSGTAGAGPPGVTAGSSSTAPGNSGTTNSAGPGSGSTGGPTGVPGIVIPATTPLAPFPTAPFVPTTPIIGGNAGGSADTGAANTAPQGNAGTGSGGSGSGGSGSGGPGSGGPGSGGPGSGGPGSGGPGSGGPGSGGSGSGGPGSGGPGSGGSTPTSGASGTDQTGTPVTSASATTTSTPTTSKPTTSKPTTSTPTKPEPTKSKPTKSGPTTSGRTTPPPTAPASIVPTTKPTTAPTTAPTDPVSTAPVTPAPTTTAPAIPTDPTTIAPPPPPVAVIGVNTAGTSISPNLVVGGPGRLSLQIVNTGDGDSAAGVTMQITVPTGVTLDQPVLSLALRSQAGAFTAAAASETCSATVGSTMNCTLPAVGSGKALTLTFVITADPTAAASSDIEVTVPGAGPTSITVNVGTGYGPVSVTSADELGRASTGVVTLEAAPLVGGTDVGDLSFPLAIAPGITITGLAPGATSATGATTTTTAAAVPGCTVVDATMVCSSGAAAAGIRLKVAVDKEAQTGVVSTAPATDQGGRLLTTGSLTVSASRNGGYADDNPVELDPVGTLAPGTDTTITLVGNLLPGVLDPGPIVIPVDLTGGNGVLIDTTDLPIGCVVTADTTPADSTVTCSPAANGGSATFDLPVTVASDASGGAPAPAMLPFPGDTPTPVSVGGSRGTGGSLTVDPSASGYQQITARVDGLNAGGDGSLTLVGTATAGISSPGRIMLPTNLGGGVRITGIVSGNCDSSDATFVCTPATKGGATTWKLLLHTDSGAAQGTLALPQAKLPGTGSLALVPDHTDLLIRAAATSCPTAATLTNGDFSAPMVPAGAGKDVVNSPTTVWQTTASDQLIEYWRNGPGATEANNGVPITGQGGTAQWVELNANQASALYQDLVTIPGHELHWKIWHRARATSVKNGQDVMQVQIGAPGTIGSVDAPGAGTNVTTISDGPAAWVEHSGTYIVPAGQTSTRFQFAAVRTSSGSLTIGNFLDNVSIDSGPCLQTDTTVTNVTGAQRGDSVTKPGDILRYDTTVSNTGTGAATNVTATGPAPANTTEISRTGATTTLGAGGTSHILLTVQVDADAPDTTVISDNAVITYLWSSSQTALTSLSNTLTSKVTAPE